MVSTVPGVKPPKPKTVKFSWTEPHDERLRDLVGDLGVGKWAVLARRMEALRGEGDPARSGKQCRERWYNHLDDRVDKNEVSFPTVGLHPDRAL